MLRGAGIFLVGFSFGVATVTTLRHEVGLASRSATLGVLLATGALLVAMTLTWLWRLERRTRPEGAPAEATGGSWAGFVWGNLALLLIYLTLVVLFLVF